MIGISQEFRQSDHSKKCFQFMDFALLFKTLSSNYSSNVQLIAYIYTHNVGMHGIIIVKTIHSNFPLAKFLFKEVFYLKKFSVEP